MVFLKLGYSIYRFCAKKLVKQKQWVIKQTVEVNCVNKANATKTGFLPCFVHAPYFVIHHNHPYNLRYSFDLNLSNSMTTQRMAHGGTLLNLYCDSHQLAAEKTKARLTWTLNQRQLCDVEMLLNGAFSPLTGFLNQRDYNSVLQSLRLADGTLWPIPINLDVNTAFADSLSFGDVVALKDSEGVHIANLIVSDCWQADKLLEAQAVFNTTNPDHPGVDYLLHDSGDFYVGGTLIGITPPPYYDFNAYRHSPLQLRALFESLQWSNVIALQTRNPLHRVHVIMTKRLMAQYQAHLVIHSAVGVTKPGDINHYCRVRCYQKILAHYPKNTALLSLLPLAMRMAGPREALWQAIIRQNYGFTHFIVGHDHAGLGCDSQNQSFYGVKTAQKLALNYQKDLTIKLLATPFLLYSPERGEFCDEDQLLPDEEGWSLSGTQLRQRLQNAESIPAWFTYPEIASELQTCLPPRSKQGITLFFTGLSGSGKSTLANGVLVKLQERGTRSTTLLDGDVVRKMLSSELTFSKEHRDLNIIRVGYVASEITKHGGIALCAPIAPYAQTRQKVRKMVQAHGLFLEIHVATPLDVCESRDRKGLYALARAGKLKGFTGIDDPYEIPENPDLRIDTSLFSIEEGINLVLAKLAELGVLTDASAR
jgi:sulfate adenylyltransferase